jgi:hypothetical protein
VLERGRIFRDPPTSEWPVINLDESVLGQSVTDFCPSISSNTAGARLVRNAGHVMAGGSRESQRQDGKPKNKEGTAHLALSDLVAIWDVINYDSGI